MSFLILVGMVLPWFVHTMNSNEVVSRVFSFQRNPVYFVNVLIFGAVTNLLAPINCLLLGLYFAKVCDGINGLAVNSAKACSVETRKISAMAIIGLICGLLGGYPWMAWAGLSICIVSLKRITLKPACLKGESLAIAGMIISLAHLTPVLRNLFDKIAQAGGT